MKVKVKSLSHVWLSATPWTVAHQAPPSVGFSRQEYWSGLPFPSPGDLPNPGIEPRSPALQPDTLPCMKQNVKCFKIVLFNSHINIRKPSLKNNSDFLIIMQIISGRAEIKIRYVWIQSPYTNKKYTSFCRTIWASSCYGFLFILLCEHCIYRKF